MAEEPTLPRLPGPGYAAPPAALFSKGRKRGRMAFGSASVALSTSSDPAVFSSDDDPALDNYMHGGARRKKRYVGSWFDQQPALSESNDSAMGDEMRRPMPKPQARQFRRQLDSGVWMAQDDSTDNDEYSELDLRPAKIVTPSKGFAPSTVFTPSKLSSPPIQRSKFTVQEVHAQECIQKCIDEGTEEVDLNQMSLETISDSILEPINQIAPIPTVTKDVAFEQRDPEIKLYLSSNWLTQFPAAIIHLQHLTVLSLRGNRLTQIPPAIASLKNLKTLNVAQNSLRHLPGELVDLMQRGSTLCELHVHPNPFYRPVEGAKYRLFGADEYDKSLKRRHMEVTPGLWQGKTTVLRARTPVQFADSARNILSEFELPDPDALLTPEEARLRLEDFSELETPAGVADPSPSSERSFEPVGAPSLFDLALRAAVRHPDAAEIEDAIDDCTMYGSLRPGHKTVFERARNIRQLGGQECCVCGRKTLNPVTEWVEFRELCPTIIQTGANGVVEWSRTECLQEAWVPFLRRGCSWDCIPAKAPIPSDTFAAMKQPVPLCLWR
ncbi:hypothetical protein B0T16DRAFT_366218 [Cercophora newfieldiana]|uniref:Uncharacterized protein n=1 Tax=Cercophora newfieldiana TaxID=92897 RepID=A0AA39YQ56_9PEZI|nr:hypothetical protein B0T16DRAFT_366218 [Cercophora newfieldiana]